MSPKLMDAAAFSSVVASARTMAAEMAPAWWLATLARVGRGEGRTVRVDRAGQLVELVLAEDALIEQQLAPEPEEESDAVAIAAELRGAAGKLEVLEKLLIEGFVVEIRGGSSAFSSCLLVVKRFICNGPYTAHLS